MTIKAEQVFRRFFRNRGSSNVFTAVEKTDLELAGGSFTVVTGRSGGGKSTLLNLLSGLLGPTGGTVSVDGADLYAMDDGSLSLFRNRNFGMVPQGQTAVFSLTVRENVLLPLVLYGTVDRQSTAYAGELLERLAIADLAGEMPADLSGGELRRMAIARALVTHPSVIFADEPTGDLDDANTEVVLSLLREQAHAGKTVFLVTHEKEAPGYADVAYRMDEGRLERA